MSCGAISGPRLVCFKMSDMPAAAEPNSSLAVANRRQLNWITELHRFTILQEQVLDIERCSIGELTHTHLYSSRCRHAAVQYSSEVLLHRYCCSMCSKGPT